MPLTHSASSPTETPTKTILVVDDDLRVLSVAEDILRSMSYSVISTIDPHVALQSARDYPGAIHLLLTDVTMPLGSGIQLAAEFRMIRPEAKVLFMSGYNVGTVEAHRLQLAPAEPFLKKPFTMDDLQSAVKAALVYRPPLRAPSRG